MLAIVFALLLATGSLFAQQTTGAARGVVTDPTGALVSGVTISAANNQTRITQTTKTSAAGAYVLPLLSPGTYTLSAESPGFSKAVRSNVVVRITETEVVDFALQLGSVSDSVTVGDTASLLQSESSAEGRVIERDTIGSLPLGDSQFHATAGPDGWGCHRSA